MNQFVLPDQFVTDDNGDPISGAKLRFYRAGTTETLTVYQDALYATAHDPDDITASANGRLPPVFIQAETYKVAVYDADDVLLFGPHDNLTGAIDLDALSSSSELYNTEVSELQADYTITVTDMQANDFFNVKPISANVTLTLPSAAEVGNGYGVTVRNGYASEYKVIVTRKPTTSETIDGATSIDITTYNEQVRLVSDGANWIPAKYVVPDQSISIDQLDPRLQGAMLPIGMPIPWTGPAAKAPAGLLLANGQTVNIADYPDLYDIYGDMYGGDDVTTFGIPDMRGMFIRGTDDSASIDPNAATRTARPDGTGGDVVGSTQADELGSHTHAGSSSTDGAHTHTFVESTGIVAVSLGGNNTRAPSNASSDTSEDGDHSHTITITATGGDETRPVNFAVQWYIVASPALNAGASGVLTKIYDTTGAPSDVTGINGDYAIDSSAGILYGPKAGGSWPSGLDLNGADGVSNIFVQDSEPAGNDGDLWVKSSTGELYKKASGSWGSALADLTGPTGASGANGANGSDGADGADGADGDPGLNWLGAWSGVTAYAVNDGVSNNGSSYICTAAHTNQEPPNASYWDVFAAKGTDGAGTGDVTGPASSTDNTIPRFDSTTGKVIQASGVVIDDSNNISGVGTVDGRDLDADGTKLDGIETGADVTDAANVASAGATMDGDTDVSGNSWVLDEDDMSSDSATKVPTQQSVKAYVDANAGGGGITTDLLALALRVADLEGDALGIVDGIADPFDDETDVDTGTSTSESYDAGNDLYTVGGTVEDGGYTIDGSQSSGGYTYVDRSWAVNNSSTVTKIGVYSTDAQSFNVKLVLRNSATDYDVVVSETLSHGGTGWEDLTLSSPYEVSASGDYYAGCYSSSTFNRSVETGARTYFTGDTTGDTNNPTSESSSSQNVPVRVTYVATSMTLQSNAFTADSAPSSARLLFQIKPIDSITINTDVIGAVSRDGGTTFTNATLVEVMTYADGTKLYEDESLDISGQPSGTSMKWKLTTANSKDVEVSGVVLQWS